MYFRAILTIAISIDNDMKAFRLTHHVAPSSVRTCNVIFLAAELLATTSIVLPDR